jgi:DNA repair ATPase RecN
MYKVKQIADMLGVETVVIHEKLIVLRDQLSIHINRNNGVIYLDEEGYRILSHEILKNIKMADQSSRVEKESILTNVVTEKDDFNSNLMQMKDRISHLKQEINKCDMQILRAEEALNHYMNQMNIDMERLKQSEAKYFIENLD